MRLRRIECREADVLPREVLHALMLLLMAVLVEAWPVT